MLCASGRCCLAAIGSRASACGFISAAPSCAIHAFPPALQPLQYFRSPAQLLVHDRPTADGLVRASVSSLSSDDTWHASASSSSTTNAHHKGAALEQTGAVAAPAASAAAHGATNGAGIAHANGGSAPAAAAGRAKAGSK